MENKSETAQYKLKKNGRKDRTEIENGVYYALHEVLSQHPASDADIANSILNTIPQAYAIGWNLDLWTKKITHIRNGYSWNGTIEIAQVVTDWCALMN